MTPGLRPVSREVSVVIPTTGGAVLGGCLDSIRAGSRWPARVVIVDQGPGTAESLIAAMRQDGLDVVHLRVQPMGISAATNLGLRQVATAFSAVTHDDCLVRCEWLERLERRLLEERDAVVTGRVEPQGQGIVLTIKVADTPAVYTRPLLTGDVLFPPNMGFPLQVMARTGWFDEHPSLATAGEDNEWAHRALRAGVRIVYDPTVVVAHLARHTASDLPVLYRRYARGQGAFYGTWLRRGDRFIMARATRDLIRAPWLLLRGIVSRNQELIAMGWGEVTGLLPGIMAGLRNPGVRR